jgi:hypothetical protein
MSLSYSIVGHRCAGWLLSFTFSICRGVQGVFRIARPCLALLVGRLSRLFGVPWSALTYLYCNAYPASYTSRLSYHLASWHLMLLVCYLRNLVGRQKARYL